MLAFTVHVHIGPAMLFYIHYIYLINYIYPLYIFFIFINRYMNIYNESIYNDIYNESVYNGSDPMINDISYQNYKKTS